MTPAERLDELHQGLNPRKVVKLSSGFVVMNEYQRWRGYCLLLADPLVPHLNALDGAERAQFLNDMAEVGDALLEVTGAKRINYSIYGNLDPFLHAHIIPRFENEPAPWATMPPLSVPLEHREREIDRYATERDDDLRRAIRDRLRNDPLYW